MSCSSWHCPNYEHHRYHEGNGNSRMPVLFRGLVDSPSEICASLLEVPLVRRQGPKEGCSVPLGLGILGHFWTPAVCQESGRCGPYCRTVSGALLASLVRGHMPGSEFFFLRMRPAFAWIYGVWNLIMCLSDSDSPWAQHQILIQVWDLDRRSLHLQSHPSLLFWCRCSCPNTEKLGRGVRGAPEATGLTLEGPWGPHHAHCLWVGAPPITRSLEPMPGPAPS